MAANYDRVDEAVGRGELWRAKEILRGRIGQSAYDPVLFERYGQVLLRMADLFEAGKFLFLSGVRREDYAPAIALFVGRYARRNPSGLWDAFPGRVRRTEISAWPAVVVDDLHALGVTKRELRKLTKAEVTGSGGGIIAAVISSLLLLVFGVGVWVILSTILSWLFW